MIKNSKKSFLLLSLLTVGETLRTKTSAKYLPKLTYLNEHKKRNFCRKA